MFGCNQAWMYGGGWLIFGWLWMVLLMLAPVLLIAALVKYVFGGWLARTHARRAGLDILNEAYARGELSREDYLQKRADLLEKP